MDTLSSRMAYEFRNPDLVKRALRHCSAGKDHNERMEFLGDAILGMVISHLLYTTYPLATEGELSRLRANLVQQSTLAELARLLGLGTWLSLGAGEIKSGGGNRDSILADAFEALVCALFLDAGLEVCTAKVTEWFAPRLINSGTNAVSKDPKTRLQEYLQARKLPLPVYSILDIEGKDHVQKFQVSCQVVLLQDLEMGSGNSRKEAEQKAALRILEQLETGSA